MMLRPRLGWLFMLYTCLCEVDVSRGAEIINGKEVKPHSMPFMAYIYGAHYCGGTLISRNWVLTAAHCENMEEVVLGMHNRKVYESTRQIRAVKRSIPHPCYDNDTMVNDLRLIELGKRVKQTKAVKVMPLSKFAVYPAAGSTCVTTGWGDTEFNGTDSDVLLAVNVTVIDRTKCNSRDYYNFRPYITSGQICAGSDGTTIAGSCQGDSGGPLLYNGYLVGVTSFGYKCGLIKKPTVYTFLSNKQLNWIKTTTGIRDI